MKVKEERVLVDMREKKHRNHKQKKLDENDRTQGRNKTEKGKEERILVDLREKKHKNKKQHQRNEKDRQTQGRTTTNKSNFALRESRNSSDGDITQEILSTLFDKKNRGVTERTSYQNDEDDNYSRRSSYSYYSDDAPLPKTTGQLMLDCVSRTDYHKPSPPPSPQSLRNCRTQSTASSSRVSILYVVSDSDSSSASNGSGDNDSTSKVVSIDNESTDTTTSKEDEDNDHDNEGNNADNKNERKISNCTTAKEGKEAASPVGPKKILEESKSNSSSSFVITPTPSENVDEKGAEDILDQLLTNINHDIDSSKAPVESKKSNEQVSKTKKRRHGSKQKKHHAQPSPTFLSSFSEDFYTAISNRLSASLSYFVDDNKNESGNGTKISTSV